MAYAALGDVVDSDWDKDSSVVHKEEEEEDTELVEEEAGKVNWGIRGPFVKNSTFPNVA